MKNKFLLLLGSFFSTTLFAQNVGIGTTTPSANAILHMVSTSKGMIIPQVSLDSLKDVTSINAPSQGLMVYNTTQPGVRNDMARGFYYYSSNALSWVRFADNLNDNPWQTAGILGIQLRDKTDGVEIMDDYLGAATNWSPKVKILKMVDSAVLNSKNNINALVLTGVERKTTAGWENRAKTSIIFENTYYATNSLSSATNTVAISAYTESPITTSGDLTNGLGFYTFATPVNTGTADIPSLSLYRHNAALGAYATDINNVTEGRLQITGFSNGDQLSLRHPSSINLKWGMYVSVVDSNLYFYSNGILRASIDRVTGVYTAISDRNMKKNIKPLNPVLDIIKQLPVYSYNYLDSKDEDHRVIGMMAQDVQPFFPELVYQRYDREITKPLLTMDYSSLGVIAIKGIQEQQKIIQELQKINDTQNSRIITLEEEIKKIKEALLIKQ